ncbi:STAS domain-containing protein [Candidatus Pseudomonas adelgestsugas]|uniref:STAS domain protein n=1 Tax=Candidatus Pseudomonas adelgestsugas TaxID=1302376 RepID=A0ABX5R884_9PSED|nr:STAS domain-containing protein [Candidatus Pseudomonas adelgestsugas]QAX81850.1 STAS domain protein [Candidatus Pseudomonas adelgestsugas]
MTESAIRLNNAGELFISGALDYHTAPDLRKQGQTLIHSSSVTTLVIDCSAVTRSSSVGLSLLLCFMRDAGAVKKQVKIRALPEDMREIAQVSGITELLTYP